MVAVYLDGADLQTMREFEPHVKGVTTNPSLMKQAGIMHYKEFARQVLDIFPEKPVSFEVLTDDLIEMEEQAYEISSWGKNIYVKIPITNSRAEPTALIYQKLGLNQVKVNVTAITALDQINSAARYLVYTPAILSIFCGRIADTGRSPLPFVTEALRVKSPQTKVLWASAREIYNYYQAQQVPADIITLTPALIRKLQLRGMNLHELSLNTVKQFYEDGKGLTL